MEGSKSEEERAKEGFNRNVNRLTEQVKETYKRAFFDLLEQKVAADPPDYEWLVRLYTEVRDKLTKILKTGSALRVEIEEAMDIELFDQMIRNKAFNPAVVDRADHNVGPDEIHKHWPEVAAAMKEELKTWVDMGCISRKPKEKDTSEETGPSPLFLFGCLSRWEVQPLWILIAGT